jgi:hypothetical protein
VRPPGFGLKLAPAVAELAEAVGAVGDIEGEVPEQAATIATDAANAAQAISRVRLNIIRDSPWKGDQQTDPRESQQCCRHAVSHLLKSDQTNEGPRFRPFTITALIPCVCFPLRCLMSR